MLLFISIIIIVLDIYAYKGLYFFMRSLNFNQKLLISVVFWIIPVSLIGMSFYLTNSMESVNFKDINYRLFFALFGIFVLFYIPKIYFNSFQLIEDIISGIGYLADKLIFNNNFQRFTFLSKFGFYVAIVVFLFIGQGILFGKYNYKYKNVNITSSRIPDSFNGFKIVQLSDIHIGSLNNKKAVEKTIAKINSMKPDVILFTGDLVNNFAEELIGWEHIFQKLESKYGTFSVLGNHDYGEYVNWPNDTAAKENLELLIKKHEEIGFKLLLNTSEQIIIENDSLAIVGVENWGLPPFHQYGDLKKALSETNENQFKILLSHDPSHWEAEILPKSNINLTLSGHTHGMQAGINLGKFKWSPVKYKYPRWSGLHQIKEQFLYVNQGFGFIGFPGRIGMPPEITVITLLTE